MQETVTQDREKYIGGSDEPAIMGISPFVSRFDLLLYKCGYKENTFKGNEVTEVHPTANRFARLTVGVSEEHLMSYCWL